jgi:hypothetical protein
MWKLLLTAASLSIASPVLAQSVTPYSGPAIPTAELEALRAQTADAKAKADDAKAKADKAASDAAAANTAAENKVSPADLNAVVSTLNSKIPVPRTAVPMAETPLGAAGTAGVYLPGDAQLPRITRAGSCALAASVCTITWNPAFPAGTNVNIVLTPIWNGTSPVMCNVTGTPTITSVSIKCWAQQTISLNLSTITAGINIIPFTSATDGVVIMATGLPKTQ